MKKALLNSVCVLCQVLKPPISDIPPPPPYLMEVLNKTPSFSLFREAALVNTSCPIHIHTHTYTKLNMHQYRLIYKHTSPGTSQYTRIHKRINPYTYYQYTQ